jgi:hypothetical protein
MNKYLFQTSEFGISDDGIHLMRSGFDYKTIRWGQINSVKIEKGKELFNWWIIFLLGVALLALGVYWSIRTVDILLHKDHAERYAKMLLFLLIPCIGVYFVYNSLKTGTILRVKHTSSKKEMFPLREIVKENRLSEFRSLVKEKLGTKVIE